MRVDADRNDLRSEEAGGGGLSLAWLGGVFRKRQNEGGSFWGAHVTGVVARVISVLCRLKYHGFFSRSALADCTCKTDFDFRCLDHVVLIGPSLVLLYLAAEHLDGG